MNKILSIAAVAALLSTGAIADNEITITGEVLPSAVVGFVDVSGQTLTGTDKFVDATIDLGSHEVDVFNNDALAASSSDIFVKTNIASAADHIVTMAITDPNGGALKDAASDATIPVKYKVGETELNPSGTNTVTLATEANDGSSAIGKKFTVTPNATATQLAGTYGTTLTVAIVAN